MRITCRDAGKAQLWQMDCQEAPVEVICLFVFYFSHTFSYFIIFPLHQNGIAKICWFEDFFFPFIRERDIFPCNDFF